MGYTIRVDDLVRVCRGVEAAPAGALALVLLSS